MKKRLRNEERDWGEREESELRSKQFLIFSLLLRHYLVQLYTELTVYTKL